MESIQLLGYGLVFLGSIMITPQIITLYQSKRTDGINPYIYAVFDFVTMVFTAYCINLGLDYSNWLECAITNVQLSILQLLVHYYNHNSAMIALTMVVKIVVSLALCYLSVDSLLYILMGLYPFILGVRILEIATIVKNKSTGQLSLGSVVIGFIMFSGRAFTSYVTDAGYTMLVPQLIDAALNLVQISLFYVFGSKAKDAKKTE